MRVMMASPGRFSGRGEELWDAASASGGMNWHQLRHGPRSSTPTHFGRTVGSVPGTGRRNRRNQRGRAPSDGTIKLGRQRCTVAPDCRPVI